MGLFLFLSVAVASLFTFIAVTVWAGERRKGREAYYHSEFYGQFMAPTD